MGRDLRRIAFGARPVAAPRRRLILGLAAREEFRNDLLYIRRESLSGARTVLRLLDAALQRLRSFPESAPVELDVRRLPRKAQARRLVVDGFIVRYVYPVQAGRTRAAVLVVSIGRAERLPANDAELLLRYAEEIVRLRRELRREKSVSRS